MKAWRRGNGGAPVGGPISGTARVDRRTKRLVKRLQPGDIAFIDHEDLDRVAAETLVEAAPAAVVNAARSITGTYPNVGPLLLGAAGIPLLDDVGAEALDRVVEGSTVELDGEKLLVDGEVVASGTIQTLATLEEAYHGAEENVGPALERFVENTVAYIDKEAHLFTQRLLQVPDVGVDFAGRHVLIVVRGADYREDLLLLRRTGYLAEKRPVLIGVDGGSDALLELGHKPDVIIGDFDSVSERALRCGATLVVHAYTDGRAPGAPRLEQLELDFHRFEAPGTSEDIAMMLADHHGAELIVAVGTHTSMVEFLDKGRPGMASTVLVRMLLGPKLVDAKGVSRLYQTQVRGRDMAGLVLAAVFTLTVFMLVSEPVRLLLRSIWYRLT
ncbi:MAG: putative cytokinetic ring protein SteA [Acidimicrobiales bacterium]